MPYKRLPTEKEVELKKISADVAEIKKIAYVELAILLALFAFFIGVLVKYFG
jgi:hypothetical protein